MIACAFGIASLESSCTEGSVAQESATYLRKVLPNSHDRSASTNGTWPTGKR